MILEQHKSTSSDSDSDLQKLLDDMSTQIPAIKNTTPKDVVHIAVLKTWLKVANVLLSRNAILLPEIHEYFKDCVQSIITARSFKMEELVDWVFGPEMDNIASNSDEENHQSS